MLVFLLMVHMRQLVGVVDSDVFGLCVYVMHDLVITRLELFRLSLKVVLIQSAKRTQ